MHIRKIIPISLSIFLSLFPATAYGEELDTYSKLLEMDYIFRTYTGVTYDTPEEEREKIYSLDPAAPEDLSLVWKNYFDMNSVGEYIDHNDTGFLSRQEVLDRCYALFADFKEEDLSGYDHYSTADEGVHFGPANAEPFSTEFYEGTENADGSIDLTVIEVWYDSYHKQLQCYHLVPNHHINLDTMHPLYYSVAEMSMKTISAEERDAYLESMDTYIIPGSESRFLSKEDLADLDSDTLKLARNEIYARKGRRFQDLSLQIYFEAKSWYDGTIAPDEFDQGCLNEYEQANITLIQSCE